MSTPELKQLLDCEAKIADPERELQEARDYAGTLKTLLYGANFALSLYRVAEMQKAADEPFTGRLN